VNTPQPLEPLQAPQTATQNTLPTLGSIFGSVLGSVLATKTKLDPVSAATVIAGCTALATGLFHLLGSKLGVPL
jgi:cobalamin synthase